MKVWFKISQLQSKVEIVTDVFCDYIEVLNVEDNTYHIVHESKITMI